MSKWKAEPLSIPGVVLLQPTLFPDSRGFFYEFYNQRDFAQQDLPSDWVQDNFSLSRKDVLRGIHFQHPHAQGKLLSVLQGIIWDVVVDLRQGSPTFGQWLSTVMEAHSGQLLLPPGVGHGFCVLSEEALLHYKCDKYYEPGSEHCLRWNDPTLGIDWPLDSPILSERDLQGRLFHEFDPEELPQYILS